NVLSGDPTNNPFLRKMNQAGINDARRGYRDSVSDFTNEVLPSIRSGAVASGGYGSSRQGIAEGLASQQLLRNARDLGINAQDAGAQLYGQAFANAQDRQAQGAGQLAQLGQQAGQFNVGQENEMQQFNARQDLTANELNNQVELQRAQAAGANRLTGSQLFESEQSMRDNFYNQMQQLLGLDEVQFQNALNQYASIVSPGAGFGGTSTTSIPIFGGSGLSQALGGGASVAGLLGSLSR
ncbi:MAG: hypothetical protein ACRERV_17010, partial [Methylococcales bacterium]